MPSDPISQAADFLRSASGAHPELLAWAAVLESAEISDSERATISKLFADVAESGRDAAFAGKMERLFAYLADVAKKESGQIISDRAVAENVITANTPYFG